MWLLLVSSVAFWSALFWWSHYREYTVIVIKPDAIERALDGDIMNVVKHDGFVIVKQSYFEWTEELVNEFYAEHRLKTFYNDLTESLVGRESIALLVMRRNAVGRWRRLMTNLRQVYAIDGTRNSLHGSDSVESAKREYNILFQY